MKYVNRITRPDGTLQLYLRKKGLPNVRLPDGLADAELETFVTQLIAELSPEEKPTVGTLRQALRAYELEDPNFAILAKSTKYEYRLILKELEDDLGKLAVSAFTPAFVNRLKGLWARRGHRAANLRLQVLKNVLKGSLIAGTLKKDPFPLVGQVRRPRELAEPHLIWSEEVFETVMAEALQRKRYGLARAVAVARYVGARRGDLVAIARNARRHGRFQYLSGKRGVRVDIPEDPLLTAWLDATPDAPPDEPRRGRKVKAGEKPVLTVTLIYNVAGRPYSQDGLGQELAKLVASLKVGGRLDSERYDLHGLRHTRGVELALAGCSDAEGAAMMGHRSAASFVQYRRQADKVRLSDAAAARLAKLREQALNERCNGTARKTATDPIQNEKGPGFSPALSSSCDGTAPRDRTEDLQIHNLAL
jgi:integrase